MTASATHPDLTALPAPLATEVEKALIMLDADKSPAFATLEGLCDRLFGAEAWDALYVVTSRAVQRATLEADGELAALDRLPAKLPRFLVKSAEAKGGEALNDALATAHRALPRDAALALRYAKTLEDAGDRAGALATLSSALEALLKTSDHSALDEILVKLLEAGEPDRLAVALPTLGTLARRGELARILPFLELAGDTLTHEAVRMRAWKELARIAREAGPAAEPLRPALERLAHALFGASAPALIEAGGLHPGGGPLADAVARFEDLAVRAPGTYHDHNSWGVGRVTALEANAVTLDFPKRTGQKMTLAAAKSALTPLPDGDVRILTAWQPAELERLRKEDPVALVASLLASLKREVTVTEIKKLLIAWNAVPNAGWTSFWNAAKKRMADDPRIDASHAFEQRYALAREGAGVTLPAFPRHDPPRKAMALLRRLMGQHKDRKAALAATWSEGLLRWADQDRLEFSDRVAALTWATELAPDPSALDGRGVALLAHAFTGVFEFASLPGTMEQRRALDWALAGPSWEAAARSALSSRLTDLREAAFAAIEERHGADAPAFWQSLWLDAVNWPGATLFSLEHADPERKPVASLVAADPWHGVRGVINLLESAPEEPIALRATALIDPEGWLADRCRARRADENLETLLTRRCLTWKTTERYLDPIIEFARAVGLSSLIQRVNEARHSRLKTRVARADDKAQAYTGKNFMTRRMYERTKGELEALETALKSTIPAAIQKARELGDLRENAEYHSAKLKQSQAEARVLLLVDRLREVTLIDDLTPDSGVAGPGTEVEVLGEDGKVTKIWILGEGDGDFGPGVVSYRAAVGRALLGAREGESVTWTADGHEVTGTVRAVRLRLPS